MVNVGAYEISMTFSFFMYAVITFLHLGINIVCIIPFIVVQWIVEQESSLQISYMKNTEPIVFLLDLQFWCDHFHHKWSILSSWLFHFYPQDEVHYVLFYLSVQLHFSWYQNSVTEFSFLFPETKWFSTKLSYLQIVHRIWLTAILSLFHLLTVCISVEVLLRDTAFLWYCVGLQASSSLSLD